VIGVGVVGTGFGRMVHVPAFLAVTGARLVGVASRDPERARRTAADYALPRSFATWQELVACPEIQAVSIATPPVWHEEIALAALAAGKAVFCEKPLAMSAAQARRLCEAAQSAHAVGMVDFELREIPAWKYAKHLLSTAEIGRLRHANISWILRSWSDESRPWTWRADSKQGGGILGSHGVHVFDYVEWLLAPIRSIAAHLHTCVPTRPDAAGVLLPVDTEDYCQMLLELEDGTPVSVTISSIACVERGHRLEFCGEKGTLILVSENSRDYARGFEVHLGHREDGLQRRIVPNPQPDGRPDEDGRIRPFVSLAQRFVDAVAVGDFEARPSFLDGLRARCLMDAAKESSSERHWVLTPVARSEAPVGERNGPR
jgi:predicted dehydrogenase